MITVELIVRPRAGARDPQADAVAAALDESGFSGCHVSAVGRYLLLELDEEDVAVARARVEELCRTLLVNPSLESYELRLRASAPGAGGAP
jgi:phosphoribosylformylglycinamidine synthase